MLKVDLSKRKILFNWSRTGETPQLMISLLLEMLEYVFYFQAHHSNFPIDVHFLHVDILFVCNKFCNIHDTKNWVL